jgi:hypothetical protein
LARSSCLLGGCSLGFGGDALEGRGLGLGSDDDLPDGCRLAPLGPSVPGALRLDAVVPQLLELF